MNKVFFLVLIITGAAVAFFSYCTLLIGWIQDYSNNVYSQSHIESILKSIALLLYTYFGIKFFNRHVGSLR